MTEEEGKELLEHISRNVELIQKKTGRRFTSLSNGMLSGFGSVVGAVLAIAIIGWFLNIIGVIPAFKNETKRWEQLLQGTQNLKTQSTQIRSNN